MTVHEPIPGIVIDPETKTFEVCGHRMVIGNLEHCRYSPGHRRDRTAHPPHLVSWIEQNNPGFYDRWQGPMPESIHASLLCGENGWWVEAHIWPGDPSFSQGLSIDVPGEPYDPSEHWTAEDLLETWMASCARRDAPPDWENDNDPGPFGGMEPGIWRWSNDD